MVAVHECGAVKVCCGCMLIDAVLVVVGGISVVFDVFLFFLVLLKSMWLLFMTVVLYKYVVVVCCSCTLIDAV